MEILYDKPYNESSFIKSENVQYSYNIHGSSLDKLFQGEGLKSCSEGVDIKNLCFSIKSLVNRCTQHPTCIIIPIFPVTIRRCLVRLL